MLNSNYSASTSIPKVLPAQIDSGAAVGDNVNLFRGSVNVPLQILELQGRNGLGVKLNAFYQSDVRDEVNRWNKEAFTGILGVGWTLDIEAIVVGRPEVANILEGQMYYTVGGRLMTLIPVQDNRSEILFQIESDPLKKAVFYPDTDIWKIFDENGIIKQFGDEANDNESSARQFSCTWDNWMGSTTNRPTQNRTIVWNLFSVSNRQGDVIRYSYDRFSVSIGNSNIAYTQSCLLKKIIDTYGRVITFEYQNKPADEIMFPYVLPRGVHLNAYQFNYETHLLKWVKLHNWDNQELTSISFHYEQFAPGKVPPYGNKKEYIKSFLSEVIPYSADGNRMPSIKFHYYTDPLSISPGSIRSVVYPQGAIVEYDYSVSKIGKSSSVLAVERPDADYVPMVWHGADFVVTAWYSEPRSEIKLEVHTWNGLWETWIDDEIGSFKMDDFELETGGNYFVYSFKDTRDQKYYVRLFHRNIYKHGEWLRTEFSVADSGKPFKISSGPDFVVAYQEGEQVMLILQWDPFSKKWVSSDVSIPTAGKVSIKVGPNLISAIFASGSGLVFRLYYRDFGGAWHDGGSQVIDQEIDWGVIPLDQALCMGSTFASLLLPKGLQGDELAYTFNIITWGRDYQISDFKQISQKQKLYIKNPILTNLITGSMIANAQHLFRFDGDQWLDLAAIRPTGNTEYSYAYQPDLVMVVDQSGTIATYHTYQFDPYNLEWNADPIPSIQINSGPNDPIPTPTCFGDYATQGNSIYYRESNNEWVEIGQLETPLDYHSVLNWAPAYIAYEVPSQNMSKIMFFKDGGLSSNVAQLHGEHIIVNAQGQGKQLTSPYAFVTFEGDSFDKTPVLKVYWVADEGLPEEREGTVISRIVTRYGKSEKLISEFSYDWTTAKYDRQGKAIQFVRAYAKRIDPSAPTGIEEYIFFNGLSPDVPGVEYPSTNEYTNARDYFGLLNGQLFKKISKSETNEILKIEQYDYFYYDKGARSNFAAGFTRLRRSIAETYLPKATSAGIEAAGEKIKLREEEVFDFNAFGQNIRTTVRYHDSSGNLRTIKRETQYAWEVYREILAENLLALIAANTEKDEKDVIFRKKVTTYRSDWSPNVEGLWCPNKEFVWNGKGESAFDFEAWSGPIDPPAHWIKQWELKAIAPFGLPLSVVDQAGNYRSILYDKSCRFVVADFLNTNLPQGEGDYYGFEPYENPQVWKITNAGPEKTTEIIKGLSYIGSSCLAISGGTSDQSGLYGSFKLKIGERYALSYYVKNNLDTSTSRAGWNMTLASGEEMTMPFSPTNGEWQMGYHLIDNSNGQYGTEMIVRAVNQEEGKEIFLDSVTFFHLPGSAEISIVDLRYSTVIGVLSSLGRTTVKSYNRFGQDFITARDFKPVNLSYAFIPNQDNEEFQKNPTLSILSRAGNSLETFQQGDLWQKHWSPSGDWQVDSNGLHHASAGLGCLQYVGDIERADCYLACSVRPLEQSRLVFKIKLQEETYIEYSNNTWALVLDGERYEHQVSAMEFQWDLICVVNAGAIVFWINGDIIFEKIGKTAISASPELIVTGEASFRFIAVSSLNQISVEYGNGLGKPIQWQQMDEGSVVINSEIYDPLGRDAVRTKAARFDQLLGFDDSIVESMDWKTGVLTGSLNAYYPADEGYPYSRNLFENNPLNRLSKVGAPGRPFAITDNPQNDHITSIAYGSNFDLNHLQDLPNGEYVLKSVCNPDQAVKTSMFDKVGNLVAEYWGSLQGKPLLTRYYYSLQNQIREIRYPNYFTDVAQAEKFRATFEQDFLGRTIACKYPDQLEGRFIYEDSGLLRFELPPEGSNRNYFLYSLYDSLGRLIESGFASGKWDEALLTKHANDKLWRPENSVWQLLNEYDGDLQRPERIGYLVRSVTRQASAKGEVFSVHVIEEFEYTQYGLVSRKTTRVEDGEKSGALFKNTGSSAFDLQGNLIRFSYNVDDPQAPVLKYDYDKLGQLDQLWEVGGAKEQSIAAFTYYPSGQPKEERYYPGSSEEKTLQYVYNSPGWLARIESADFIQTLHYNEGGKSKFYSGKIASQTDEFVVEEPPQGFLPKFSYQYRYGASDRLEQADNDQDATYSLGQSKPIQYDANGNILELQRGRVENKFFYAEGANQLIQLDPRIDNVQYEANGDILSLKRDEKEIKFEYSRLQSNLLSIGQEEFSLNLYANRNNGVVYRRTQGGTFKHLFRALDSSNSPLVESELVDGEYHKRYFVYGASGMMGYFSNGDLHFLIKDHLGSIRGQYGRAGLTSAYNYMPFGEDMGAGFGTAHYPLDQRFAGQEKISELGLYLDQVRVYDPVAGRFYQVDPDGQFPSPYVYAADEPILVVDPSGEFAVLPFILALVVGGLVGGAIGGTLNLLSNLSDSSPAEQWQFFGYGFLLGFGFGAVSAGVGFVTAPLGVGAALAIGIGSEAVLGGVESIGLNRINKTIKRDPSYGVSDAEAFIFGAIGGAVLGGAGTIFGRVRGLRGIMSEAETQIERYISTLSAPVQAVKRNPRIGNYFGIYGNDRVYTGISVNLRKRLQQHGARFDELEVISEENLQYYAAHGLEQHLMDINPGFTNKIRSIREGHPVLEPALTWGRAFWEIERMKSWARSPRRITH